MAASRARRNSMEKLRLEMEDDNDQGSRYACDCGQDFFEENYFKQHQLNNCKNRQVKCSFCEEKFSSIEILKNHLLVCGNKTEQCPNCRQFIRRSHFTYHYENQCASVNKIETPPRLPKNPANQRLPINSNIPIARTDVSSDDLSRNQTKTNGRILLPISTNMRNSPVLIECEYCFQKCTKDDWRMHIENCLKNPGNSSHPVNIQLTPTKSNGVAHVPCEICHELIDIPNWSKHTQDCREKEKQRVVQRAQLMSREPVTENLPCENCNKLIPAARLNTHQINCPTRRVGAQYEIIDHDRTREENEKAQRHRENNQRFIQSDNSFSNPNQRQSRDNLGRKTPKNDIPQRGRSNDQLYYNDNNQHLGGRIDDRYSSQHRLRPGYNRIEIINNQEGQRLQKKKKRSLWKRLCCGNVPDTVDD